LSTLSWVCSCPYYQLSLCKSSVYVLEIHPNTTGSKSLSTNACSLIAIMDKTLKFLWSPPSLSIWLIFSLVGHRLRLACLHRDYPNNMSFLVNLIFYSAKPHSLPQFILDSLWISYWVLMPFNFKDHPKLISFLTPNVFFFMILLQMQWTSAFKIPYKKHSKFLSLFFFFFWFKRKIMLTLWTASLFSKTHKLQKVIMYRSLLQAGFNYLR